MGIGPEIEGTDKVMLQLIDVDCDLSMLISVVLQLVFSNIHP